MTGAAHEQVASALREVAALIDEVEEVAGRLSQAGQIDWSGTAAQAWRARLAATARGVGDGRRDLVELHEQLSALLESLR